MQTEIYPSSLGKIQLEVEGITKEDTLKLQEILTALVASGCWRLPGGGKAILHFDHNNYFLGVELDYWAFRRKPK